jgi:hypothetical protein
MMALTDFQLTEIKRAAALLPVNARDAFLRSVANRLADSEQCNDQDIAAAIEFVLSCRGVSAPSKQTPNGHARRQARR